VLGVHPKGGGTAREERNGGTRIGMHHRWQWNGRKEGGTEEVSTLTAYGGTSDAQLRDDKTEVMSLG
jgi:hypothetical protein